MYKNKCPTCKESYSKSPTYCGNSFHCCRDCVWNNGKRTKICSDCIKQDKENLRKFRQETARNIKELP